MGHFAQVTLKDCLQVEREAAVLVAFSIRMGDWWKNARGSKISMGEGRDFGVQG